VLRHLTPSGLRICSPACLLSPLVQIREAVALPASTRCGKRRRMAPIRPLRQARRMRSPDFWAYFDEVAGPLLAHRAAGFRKIFTYLDRFDRPVGIVETGCVRHKDNWAGDGHSTIMFDRYVEFHPPSVAYSVDRDAMAVALCQSVVGERTRVQCGDSVAYLKSLADDPPSELVSIDLLYLDSYDVNFDDPLPSAIHHLKELAAITPLLSAETLVVVDDSPTLVLGIPAGANSVEPIRPPRIGGKGQLIAEYAAQIGAELFFAEYQCGWRHLGRVSTRPT
jgi:hypothetical protein